MQTELARVNELLSNAKAYAAALSVAVPGVGVFITNLIESGTFDATEFRILMATAVSALFTGVATHQTPAGNAEVEVIPGSSEVEDDEPMPEGDVTKFGDKS